MSHIRHITFSAFCIFNISLSNEPTIKNDLHNSATESSLPKKATNKKTLREILSEEQSDIESKIFSTENIEEVQSVFFSSPQKAQTIFVHINDSTLFPQIKNLRSFYFIGDPGSDKTTMANIIAYAMYKNGWECQTISSTSIVKEKDDKLSIILPKKLNEFLESEKPTIVIIEELDELLYNSHHKYHDLDAASKSLWAFLDQQKDNKNFFLIGTMNSAAYLPDSFKDRLLLNSVKFPLISNRYDKTDLLRKYLANQNITLDQEVTDDFLNEELNKIGSCSRNNLKRLSTEIIMTNKVIGLKDPSLFQKPEDADLSMIHKIAITEAINEYIKNKKELGLTNLTDFFL